jgi:hypothetical protein
MNHIDYFKLQAKNLYRDYQTKKPVYDHVIEGILYEYSPKYFNIDEIVNSFNLDEDNFTLMKAQHIIAILSGFKKWASLIKASETELELGKLLLDNREKIPLDDWDVYLKIAQRENKNIFNPDEKLEIFKTVFLNADG